jgi:hypothetical protein
MKVITVINDKTHAGFNLFRLSCAVNNLELVVLFYNQRNFVSNRLKDELLKDYLTKIDSEEVILFSDGNDVIFMASEEEMLDKYYKAGKEVVFSAEIGCWPDVSLAEQYPPVQERYKYLNSGGFIGKAGVIRKLLEDDSVGGNEFRFSNQYIWAKRFFKYPDIIGLDYGCNIFYTFTPEVGKELINNEDPIDFYLCIKGWFDTNFYLKDNRVFSKITNTSPCHLHFNGSSKVLMDADIINLIFSGIPQSKQAKFIRGKLKMPQTE